MVSLLLLEPILVTIAFRIGVWVHMPFARVARHELAFGVKRFGVKPFFHVTVAQSHPGAGVTVGMNVGNGLLRAIQVAAPFAVRDSQRLIHFGTGVIKDTIVKKLFALTNNEVRVSQCQRIEVGD